MIKNCMYLNILRHRDVTDTLAGFVVLTFFIALILTVVIVILLVRYVTSQLHIQREKEQYLKMNGQMRSRRKISEGDESTDDYPWSDSDSVDLNAHYKLEDDNRSDVTSIQHFETNYVSDIKVVDEIQGDIEPSRNKYGDILIQNLNGSLNFKQHSDKAQLFKRILFKNDRPNNVLTEQFQTFLIHIIQFRKNAFSLVVNFVLEYLCKSHVITQDLLMLLQSKYCQKLEEYDNVPYPRQILQISQVVQDICKQFLQDMKEYLTVKKLKTLENCMNIFSSIHLNSLKVLSLELNSTAEYCYLHLLSQLQCSFDINGILNMVKYRILYMHDAVTKINDAAEINNTLNDHLRNVSSILDSMDSYIEKELESTLLEVAKQRHSHTEKFLQKVSSNEINLKYEILEEGEGNMEEKLKSFQQYLVALFQTHLKERNKLILELSEYEGKTIKTIFTKVQKSIFQDISETEERVFATLQNECHFTDDQVLSVVENIQNLLQNTKQEYANITNTMMERTLHSISNQSKNLTILIDHLIKQVSHEFRYLVNTSTGSLKMLPSFNEDLCEKNVSVIRNKFSISVFDIVAMIASHIINVNLVPDNKENEQNQVSVLHLLKQKILNHSVTDDEIFIFEDLLGNLTDVHVEENKPILRNDMRKKYHSILLNILHKHVFVTLENEIERNYCQSISAHLNDHVHMYETLTDFLSSKRSSGNTESSNEKNSKKYLSRKSSSFKPKRKDQELFEIYLSHLSMKDNKHAETCNQLEQESSKSVTKSKEKSLPPNISCTRVLEDVLEFFGSDSSAYLRSAFETEQHYILERFLKKIYQFLEENHEESDQENTKNNPAAETVHSTKGNSNSKKKATLSSKLGKFDKKKNMNNADRQGSKHRGKNVVSPVQSPTDPQKLSKHKGSTKLNSLRKKKVSP